MTDFMNQLKERFQGLNNLHIPLGLPKKEAPFYVIKPRYASLLEEMAEKVDSFFDKKEMLEIAKAMKEWMAKVEYNELMKFAPPDAEPLYNQSGKIVGWCTPPLDKKE